MLCHTCKRVRAENSYRSVACTCRSAICATSTVNSVLVVPVNCAKYANLLVHQMQRRSAARSHQSEPKSSSSSSSSTTVATAPTRIQPTLGSLQGLFNRKLGRRHAKRRGVNDSRCSLLHQVRWHSPCAAAGGVPRAATHSCYNNWPYIGTDQTCKYKSSTHRLLNRCLFLATLRVLCCSKPSSFNGCAIILATDIFGYKLVNSRYSCCVM